ncbi:hypothetical protein OROGR_002176 [Orobanche gracilis]
MDNRDLASGSCSEMRKKLKLDDSEEVVGDNLTSLEEKEKEGHKALANLFIHGGINPNTIKSHSFAKFMRLLNPNSRLSVSLVEKEVLEIHEECKEKAKKFLKDFQGKVTLSYEWMVLGHDWTRDYIKSPILHEDFVCITAHFIDDNWKVRKRILGYTTDESVSLDDCYIYAFRNAVQGFEIENKVSTLLLPNTEGFDEETLGSFRKGIEEKGDNSITPPVFLLYCCADLFWLMVDDVFNDLSASLLEDLRMLVGWGRCSSNNWNLWLSNLQRAVDMKNEDEFSKDEIYDDYDKPTDEEWIKIQTYCKLVGCIYKVAVELFEGGYSTSNVYFHLLAELKVMLNQELESANSDYFLHKAKVILKRFDKYWNHMFLVLATASMLDPRFKMKYLEFYCSKNQVCDGTSKAETVFEYLHNLYACYAASDICQKPIGSGVTNDSKEDDGGGEKEENHDEEQDGEEDYDEEQEEGEEDYAEEQEEGEDGYDEEEEEDYDEEHEEGEEDYDSDSSAAEERAAQKDREKKPDACKDFAFFQEFLKFEGSPREFGESELDSYLKEPVMEWNKDFKALDWWREEGHKYPILSRVARDILSIPISRATSYNAYVSYRREPPEFVLSLEPKVANAMMCSQKWLQL